MAVINKGVFGMKEYHIVCGESGAILEVFQGFELSKAQESCQRREHSSGLKHYLSTVKGEAPHIGERHMIALRYKR